MNYNAEKSYIADTNMNTLLEGGIAIEIEFESEKNCKSAEDTYLRTLRDSHDVVLGSQACWEMVSTPDGCLECRNFVECILNIHVETILTGERRKLVKQIQRTAKRLCK